MALDNDQLAVLKTAIQNETDVTMNAFLSAGNLPAVADWYNEDSTFKVWKTYLDEHTITDQTSSTGTVWSWTDYIATTVSEKMAWERIFNGTYSINPSLPQVRAGIADIFSGPSGANQRAHLLAISVRFANRVEALFATGTGTQASPGNLVYDGFINYRDIERALALP